MNQRSQESSNRPVEAEPASPGPAAEEAALPETKVSPSARPAPARVDRLPAYRVILHNDDVNDILDVVETICDLTPLNLQRAAAATLEAHNRGLALLLTTHRERAELYVEQFRSKSLTVTIEAADC